MSISRLDLTTSWLIAGAGGRRVGVVGSLAVAAIFLAAVALPLATYTAALAMFGLAHVGSELRYVDYRLGSRLPGGVVVSILAPLAAAVLVRTAGLTGILASTTAVVGELALGAVMAAAAVAAMRHRRVVGACAAGALVAGAVLAPFQTLLFLSIAHNLTPLAFLADALEGAVRRRVLLLMSVLFLVMPVFIASGLPYALLSHAGLPDAEASVFSAGPLLANIGVYGRGPCSTHVGLCRCFRLRYLPSACTTPSSS